MLKIEFTEAEIGQLYREFMAHLSVAAKKKLLVVYLKAPGLPRQVVFASRESAGIA